MILAIGGLILGFIASLVGSIYWIAQKSGESWKAMTWIGIAIGLASGLAIWNSALLDSVVLGDIINWFPGTIIFLTTMAFLGGLIGGATSLLRKH